MDKNTPQNNTPPEQNAPDFAGDLFKLAVDTKLTTAANREGFDAFEKAFVNYIYERLGLKDVPDKYINFAQFIDVIASTLMQNVQKDVDILNLRRRLAMIGLANTIQEKDKDGTAQKVEQAAAEGATEGATEPAPEA